MSKVVIEGLDRLEKKFDQLSEMGKYDVIIEFLRTAGIDLSNLIKININKTFHTGTGQLVNSIQIWEEGGSDKYAYVDVGSSGVVYARIHEYGGIIVPRTKKVLHFVINGEDIFTTLVVMPARPYMRPALDEEKGRLPKELGAIIDMKLKELCKE